MDLRTLGTDDLAALRDRLRGRYDALRARGLNLNLARGKPSTEQVMLSEKMLDLPGTDTFLSKDGDDVRNYYGPAQGLPEARALFSGILGAPIEQIVLGDNSSLALMHDVIVYALLHGTAATARVRGPRRRRSRSSAPSPGYDRHFAICERLRHRDDPGPARPAEGPDMDVVEPLVAERPDDHGRCGACRSTATRPARSTPTRPSSGSPR